MDELEKKCGITNGFEIGTPSSMAGWTFFNIHLSQEMASKIEDSGMMEGALGYRIGEQLKNFLGHFLVMPHFFSNSSIAFFTRMISCS